MEMNVYGKVEGEKNGKKCILKKERDNKLHS
jgi:hypothetical protein